ncbi:MAG: hypothetical protein NT015_13040 [Alphaproteobacteria bacterium]|nr:hypothetical protein [Alphaproteobacteria bacterium]
MTKRRSTLTGSWSGAYRYPNGRDETVFNAQIEETNGAFVGATQEPNEFLNTTDSVLHGEIDGLREGNAVTFVKFYNHGDKGARHSIRYHGSVDAKLSRMEGRWIVSSDWSGTFFMTRDDLGEETAVEREVEVPIETRK